MTRRSLARIAVLVTGLVCFFLGTGGLRAEPAFIRGDVDGNERLSITDVVKGLRSLFLGDPLSCEDAADANDDGDLNLADAIHVLTYLFSAGESPPFPFPRCGGDPTEDALGCESVAGCRPAFSFDGEPMAGDAVVFVVDRSGSMRDSGELQRAKNLILATVSDLDEDVRAGVIFLDARIIKYPPGEMLPLATQQAKEELAGFLDAVLGGSGSCPTPAFLEALGLLRSSGSERGVIVYVGDGGGTCSGSGQSERDYLRDMVDAVTAENEGLAQIYTVGVLMRNRSFHRAFLTELAERNAGRYVGRD